MNIYLSVCYESWTRATKQIIYIKTHRKTVKMYVLFVFRFFRQFLNAAFLCVMTRMKLCSTLYPTIPFSGLPLSLLQQCLREVRKPPCEIHIHPLYFSPRLIVQGCLWAIRCWGLHIYVLSLSFSLICYKQMRFILASWRKPCLAASVMEVRS